MLIQKRYQAFISFARFVTESNIKPHDAALLCQAARAAFRAGERELNTGKSADGQRNKVAEIASAYRWRVEWPGLMPVLVRGKGRTKRTLFLPAIV